VLALLVAPGRLREWMRMGRQAAALLAQLPLELLLDGQLRWLSELPLDWRLRWLSELSHWR
jgi:hypothetical protein